MREYKTLHALRGGQVVDLGGLCFTMDEGDIKPGDLYIAERNTGPQLLTARIVDQDLKCVHPTSIDYSFSIGECVKVREAP